MVYKKFIENNDFLNIFNSYLSNDVLFLNLSIDYFQKKTCVKNIRLFWLI